MVKFEEIPAQNVEEDISSDSESEADMPTLENAEQSNARTKLNRAEKKARKAMEKAGLKPFAGVNRVTVRKGRQFSFSIINPEVMRNGNTDLFVVFGEAKFDDINQQQQNAAQRFTHAPEITKVGAPSVAQPQEEESNEPVDDSGLEAKDIELIMSQVNCSRGRAVTALRQANGDIVEAIMQLSA